MAESYGATSNTTYGWLMSDGAGVTVAEMRRCHWLNAEMVCQVKFSEWTRDDKLRQPVFLGLREDKSAAEIVLD